MADALIGHTGFIGTNLLTQRKWDATFNRSNADELRGDFDTVVCCAAPGTKWIANENSYKDLYDIMILAKRMGGITTRRFILISTADVFGQPVDADEKKSPHPDCDYGRNRLWLEKRVRIMWMFGFVQIVRLPGVVGPGLKKGPIFDLQNERRLEHLNPDSVYQWYDVQNLWHDIKDRTEPIIHLCPKPESLRETVERDFPHLIGKLTGTGPATSYNLRTVYGEQK